MKDNRFKEAAKAVMIGHAVADALGVPVEFSSRESLNKYPLTDMRGWGTYNMPEGCWSDDTSMSLATLDALGSGTVDYGAMMKNFVAWYREGKYTPTGEVFDIGGVCRDAIEKYIGGAPLFECGATESFRNGNGSLMRIHPVALFLYFKGCEKNDALRSIEKASSLTHAHARSSLGCGIYSLVLWELLSEQSVDSVTRGLAKALKIYSDSPEIGAYARLFSEEFKSVPIDEIRSTGYVVDTLEAAIYCLLTTKSYKECVLKAVNLGSDTDTVAAVAGGLAGAMYGFSEIPEDWRKRLKKYDYIEKMCADIFGC